MPERQEHERTSQELLQFYRIRTRMLEDGVVGCQTAENIDAALRCAAQGICRHGGWAVAHVYKPNPADPSQLLPTDLWQGDTGGLRPFIEVTSESPFAVGEGLPGQAAATGRTIWIPDVREEPAFRRLRKAPDAPVRAAMAFAVRDDGKTVAVLEFFHPERIEPDPVLFEVIAQLKSELGQLVQRKHTEAALKQSSHRFRAVVRETPIPLINFECNGTITLVNDAVSDLLHYEPNELIGRPIEFLVAAPYRRFYRTHLRRLQRGQSRNVLDKAYRGHVLRKDGVRVPIEFQVSEVHEHPNDACYVAIMHHVGERENLERRLSTQHRHFQQIMRHTLEREQRERQQAADKLHEDIAQTLAGCRMRLEGVSTQDPAEMRQAMQEICELLQQAMNDTRSVAMELGWPVFPEMTLRAALLRLSDQAERQKGVRVSVEAEDVDPDERTRLVILYAARELLQHATGTIALRVEQRERDVQLTAEESAQEPWLDPDLHRPVEGPGLLTASLYVTSLGGTVQIEPAEDGGTRIKLRIPTRHGDMQALERRSQEPA